MIHSTHVHSERGTKEQEYLAGWQRARADLDNFRRRLESESEDNRARITKDVMQSLLGLADNFEAIVQHRPENLEDNAWAEGVLHVARQLQKLLADFGVTPISPAGEEFDPIRHDAVSSVKTAGLQSGTVIEVVQPGYLFRDQVLRPAKVKIAQ